MTRSERIANKLWVVALGFWGAALAGPVVAAAVQALVGTPQPGLLAAGPATPLDAGMWVFLIAVPAAFACTVLAWMFPATAAADTKTRRILGWAGLVTGCVAAGFVGVMVSGPAALFVALPGLVAVFGLS